MDSRHRNMAVIGHLGIGLALAAAAPAALRVVAAEDPTPEPATFGLGDLPDRLSVDDRSPYFEPNTKGIGVRFNGKVRPNDVIEYCVSEGWVRLMKRMANGKPIRERGRYVGVKFHGTVEPFRQSASTGPQK